MIDKLLSSVIFIRLMVGAVFISEGIQKFIFPNELGAGRFLKIGLPWPGFFGYFVPFFEITCGALILIGLFTRSASIPLMIIILTAIISTKVPLLINEGFWKMAHEARTDWSMLLGLIFLMIAGSGKFSFDNILSKTPLKLPKGET
jgi:putative oxidoreductase